MIWLIAAIGAYFLFSITTVLDKFILSDNKLPSPVSYAFYTALLESFAILLLPFGFVWPGMYIAFIALASGFLFILSLLFLFSAIIRFETSKVAPIVGVLTSLFLFALSFTRQGFALSSFEMIAFALLVLGTVLITWKRIHMGEFGKLFGFSLLAAVFASLSFFIGKIAYQETNFITTFILGRMGGLGVAVFLFMIPYTRIAIKGTTGKINRNLALIFGANKAIAASGFILFQYALSLGNVALVQAMQSVQYLFLVIITTFLSLKWHTIFKEDTRFLTLARKTFAILIIACGLFLLMFSQKPAHIATGTKTFGMTFSQIYANDMGLDWKETYTALLDDVGIKHLRIPAYWTKIEPTENTFDFTDLDWQVSEAQKRGADVVVVVGYRVPRWPECHIPDWAKDKPQAEFQTAVLNEITEIVMRYRDNPTIIRWQIENEPFLKFGVCPTLDVSFLDREIALVRSLDKRPIIISDSGELSTWVQASRRADIFGTTMYRTIWNEYIGQFTYPLPPEFFHFKANIADAFGGVDKMIVIELQAEPWGPGLAHTLTPDVEAQSFSPDKFHATIGYVKAVGFPEAYLWGGEWWYFKKAHGDDRFWNIAKDLYAQSL